MERLEKAVEHLARAHGILGDIYGETHAATTLAYRAWSLALTALEAEEDAADRERRLEVARCRSGW